jgi:pyruvate dehydrogenase E1 component alpha subunit
LVLLRRVIMKTEPAIFIDMYRTMVRIRKFEERLTKEFAAGRIPGTVHLYIGEEAYCKGKGGSMHIADPDIGILGANGIVGGGICVASGAALACRMKRKGQVVVCFLGDGSTNEGSFHEGVNLASIWDLPVVFAIENNLYAEKTRITDTAKIIDLADRAKAYGIPGVVIDGNDLVRVHETMDAAIARAREGKGPTLIECKTYRWRGHFEGDMQTYKDKAEMEDWIKKDPIPRFRKYLAENKVLSPEGADKIDLDIAQEIEDAIKFALESPYPSPEEAEEDVFA